MARISLTLVSVGPVRISVADRLEQPVAVMGGEHRARIEARARARAPACRASTIAPATSSMPSIPSVSPAIAQMSGAPSKRHREAEQELGVAPAVARPAAGRSSPSSRRPTAARQAGRAAGRGRGRCGRCRPSRCPSRALRLPAHRPASAAPGRSRARPRAMRVSAIIGVAIRRNSAFGKLPGFGVSSVVLRQPRGDRGGRVDAVAGDDRARIGECGGVRHRRAGGDHRRIVARHVADRQRHDARRRARRRRAGRP